MRDRVIGAEVVRAQPEVPREAVDRARDGFARDPNLGVRTATAQQLTVLPGVGEKLAARIVEYRQKSGGFKNVQELMNVRGVGEKNFLKLKPQITVGPAKADHPDER